MFRYNFITANGDPTSYLHYKQIGNNVVLKYINSKVIPVASAPMFTETVSLQKLINEYYSTARQRNDINNMDNQIPIYPY